ncbi:MAG: pyridoxamine 5'-phosphate oxidase family protein [Pseudomonadota bacterium]
MSDGENREQLRTQIATMLQTHSTMNMATCADNTPWASAVFYASDDDLRLYFLTSPRTRRGQHLVAGRAAATINADVRQWGDIRGLQLEGSVTPVDDVSRQAVETLYLDKFAELREADAALWQRLRSTPFYQFCPSWIRIIDNSVSFGHKAELTLSHPQAS